ATVTINSDGEVTALSNTVNGNGYNTVFDVEIQPMLGAPGTGAKIKLTQPGINVLTKENTWAGASTVISGGSGYRQQ
ncbi:hypothetical protein HMI54_012836, partial [Coelomomyces lativittatus]